MTRAPGTSPLFRPPRLLGTVALLAAVAIAALWLIPSQSYLILPDPAHPVAPLVTVPRDKAKPAADGGGIYFVDVIQRRATLLERLLPVLREDGAELVPARDVNQGSGDAERRRRDLAEMARSQQVAAAVALRALGYSVIIRPTGVIVQAVAPDAPAAEALRRGDLIVGVDAMPVRALAELRRRVGARRPGAPVRLSLRRDRRALAVTVKTVSAPSNPRRAIIGIEASQAAFIRLPLKVRIDTGAIGGPSAGLAFVLGIMEKLGRDVDRGYRVAATGTIEIDGSVGAVGGVEQKVIGAEKADVDVFLVPEDGDNDDEARRHADEVRVIPVSSLPQALRALATLAPKR